MQEIVEKIKQTNQYEVGILSMEAAKEEQKEKEVLKILMEKMQIAFAKSFPPIESIKEIPRIFTKQYFQKPMILVLDEFDSLQEAFINRFAGIFRDMFTTRSNERNKSTQEKSCLLHGLALIGVRSVLGIENERDSPFNVQRSLHIPNLTFDEVKEMFSWYEKDSGQTVQPEVIQNLFQETNGQPGLTCWFGELLSEGCEGYENDKSKPITPDLFEEVLAAAVNILPNNNILNIISKANEEEYRDDVLDLFKTDQKVEIYL
jgi:hypothetical protein